MELSGKLIRRLATWDFGLTPEQGERLAQMAEAGEVIADRRWRSWEEFIEAHKERI